MSSMAVLLISAYKFTVKYCYNSKCEDFSCFWGILRIRRNIQAELDLDTQQHQQAAVAAAGRGQDSGAQGTIEEDDEHFDFHMDRTVQFMDRRRQPGGGQADQMGQGRQGAALDDDDIV